MKVGDVVRIERDEKLYPSRGTWPKFRGRTGTVVEVNRAGKGDTEYGVVFSGVSRRTDGKGELNWSAADVAWFKLHEIARVAAVRNADGFTGRVA